MSKSSAAASWLYRAAKLNNTPARSRIKFLRDTGIDAGLKTGAYGISRPIYVHRQQQCQDRALRNTAGYTHIEWELCENEHQLRMIAISSSFIKPVRLHKQVYLSIG